MHLRLVACALVGVLTLFVHGCDSAPAARDGDAAATDALPGGGGAVGSGAGDGAVDLTMAAKYHDGAVSDRSPEWDGVFDAPSAVDQAAADSRTGGNPVDAAGCTTQTVILARAGTTSSCSFKVSTSVPRDRVNLVYGGRRLCRQGSNNCSARGGWFWFGDEVALCDATCLSWEASGANLVLEVGCPSESCVVACREEGGLCGDGVNSCCAGWRCTGGTCVGCARGGQACNSAGDCCSGTCQNGMCVGGLGSVCVSQAGCAQGECRDGRCQCGVNQILCSGLCVSFTDPNNCRGCGNVCATGTGRVCTVNGCVCDPASAFPDQCGGVCVNKSTDRNNCGFCSFTCPRLDQVCVAGRCGCPAGQTDCNGTCFDTRTSPVHCGMCNRTCSPSTEVCSEGTCVCAPGFTRCSGTCVNLMTSKLNCGTCGHSCPGNKTCNNGTCG